nr:hypothetical protein BaRGS_017920 [Batillaria attramentaria]
MLRTRKHNRAVADLIAVYCDQDTAGGGWAVIQRRKDGSVDFYRRWVEYEKGFGDVEGEFWLGLRNIYRLTSSQKYSLRIDLEDWDGNTAYAEYRDFSISGPDDFYRLSIAGYSGTAGDEIIKHYNLNSMQFSTPDKDHDTWWNVNCAKDLHKAGWWFRQCATASLNGRYKAKGGRGEDGIVWNYFAPKWTSLKSAEMKIRPRT